MAKSPPIPKEQRGFKGPRVEIDHPPQQRHDEDMNLSERGETANMRQNMVPKGRQPAG